MPDMILKVQDTGFTGFYFRVLKEGFVCKDRGLKRISRHPKGITISYANRIKHHEKNNIEGIKTSRGGGTVGKLAGIMFKAA